MRSPIGTVLLVVLASGVSVPTMQSRDDQLHIVLPKDAIRAIDRPDFEPARTADRVMASDELVIGLVGEREQRAYSTWQLDRSEIVNDVFEGRPIAVTWCPLCGTGVVFDRTVGTRTLTFGVSGMLFRDALVMFDRETDTLWTHVDGHAIRGPLAGRSLVPVAAVHATWKQWKTMYPDSVVLKKRGEFRSPYESYNRSSGKLGIFGRRNEDTRLPGKERILGIRADGVAMVFPVGKVRQARLVHAQIGSLPVVLAAAEDRPVVAYDRRLNDVALTFTLAQTKPAALRDVETGTVWRLSDGLAVEGPLKGQHLTRVVAHPAFWFGWRGYFPHSKIWTSRVTDSGGTWRSPARPVSNGGDSTTLPRAGTRADARPTVRLTSAGCGSCGLIGRPCNDVRDGVWRRDVRSHRRRPIAEVGRDADLPSPGGTSYTDQTFV